MLNYNAFETISLSNTLTLLNMFEGHGVIDIRFVRQRLQNEIDQRFKGGYKAMTKEQRAEAKQQKLNARRIKKRLPGIIDGTLCPVCGSIQWILAIDTDGVEFRECKDCRYSVLEPVKKEIKGGKK